LKIRRLTRRHYRTTLRYTTRMLGGVHRPRPTDYLALYCRLVKRIIKIDESLVPFMQQQVQLLEKHRFEEEIQAALQRVYGSDPPAPQPGGEVTSVKNR
jgi:hypothetical protein